MEMAYTELNAKLCAFLDKTPNSFFAVKNIKEELATHGFAELQENSRWQLQAGGKYYVSRNGSALLAFVIPKQDYLGFQVYACHCDSPAFKLKNNAEIVVDKKYVKLNVEKYGGMLLNTWLDRPLSVAGRVLCNVDGRLEARLVNVEQDLMMIPNLAIHMNREANDGVKLNAQTDMLPLIGSAATKNGLQKLLAEPAALLRSRLWIRSFSFITECLRLPWAWSMNMLPAAGWMICSVCLPDCRAFWWQKQARVCRYSACWITKRLVAGRSRARRRPS